MKNSRRNRALAESGKLAPRTGKAPVSRYAAKQAVEQWRADNPAIVAMWKAISDA